MFHDDVVKRRKWLSDQEFLDLLGATNLIPGPNSTEMAIHLGYRRAGFSGLVVAGAGFILPATLIVMALSWVYVRYGSTPQAGWLLYGIKPVVIAIILQALWLLGRKAVKGPLTAAAGLVALVLYFLGVSPVPALLIGGFLVMVGENLQRLKKTGLAAGLAPFAKITLAGLALTAASAVPFSQGLLFLTFLKIGSVLYGSGYVLLAFLQADFVERLGWLTESQVLDAIAVGQLTPGPVFTTATFIGYLLGGVPGGLVATLGIFLPSFIFVAISNPLIPHLRRSPWAAGLLNGVNAASLGLMAAVTWQLGRTSLVDPLTVILALLAAVLLFRFSVNTTWLILGGGMAGLLRALLP
jgi:chromate transporter